MSCRSLYNCAFESPSNDAVDGVEKGALWEELFASVVGVVGDAQDSTVSSNGTDDEDDDDDHNDDGTLVFLTSACCECARSATLPALQEAIPVQSCWQCISDYVVVESAEFAAQLRSKV